MFEHHYPTTCNAFLLGPGMSLCVYRVCSMADRKRLLLEAGACVGSDHMFKGCVRENPHWGEPCAGSVLACWWVLLRCCQRHRDNGQSMQNHSRSTDGSGGINEIHALTYKDSTQAHYWWHSDIILKGERSEPLSLSRKLNTAIMTDPDITTPESWILHNKHKDALSHGEFHHFECFNIQYIE